MLCPHCQTPIPPGRPLSPQDRKALRSKSTATETQADRILAALREGPKTTDDFRSLGIYQSAARVNGLRKDGYVIETELYDGWSADGYRHARMALYRLIEEPLPLLSTQAQDSPKTDENGGEVQCKH